MSNSVILLNPARRPHAPSTRAGGIELHTMLPGLIRLSLLTPVKPASANLFDDDRHPDRRESRAHFGVDPAPVHPDRQPHAVLTLGQALMLRDALNELLHPQLTSVRDIGSPLQSVLDPRNHTAPREKL